MKGTVRESWGHAPDGSTFSRETLLVAGARLPDELERFLTSMDRLYYAWIPRLTGGAVEIVRDASGGAAAKVVPIGPVGLALGAARIEGTRIERPILSGWLVAEASGTLAQELVPREGGVEVAVDLRGFRPRLLRLPGGRALYDNAQESIHRRLSRGYLRHDVAPRLRSVSCSSSTPTRT